jgi:hypothetical protein
MRCVLPGAALLLVPKCPLCVATYVAAATGIGVSLSVAASLRSALIALCLLAMAWLIVRPLRRQRS